MHAAAAAYLPKTSPLAALPDAVRRVARGERVSAPPPGAQPRPLLAQLTVRELEVFEGVAEGLTNRKSPRAWGSPRTP
jgi:DNA-binding NarL/FixJ family response regulator